MAEDAQTGPEFSRPPRAPGQSIWIAAGVAFVLGLGVAGGVGWLSGADFGQYLGLSHGVATSADAGAHQPYPAAPPPVVPNGAADTVALAGRVAAMEQRVDRLDYREQAASGNAARAEALLVAFAVRRVVERGAPLGYLGDQLKLRFGDAQPHAVTTIIAANKDLVPLALLAARLEMLAPQLTETGQQSLWRRVIRDVSTLFVVRRDRPAQSEATARFDDARKALGEGRIDDAVADVQHLSNGADAASWTVAARRYRDVEAALDLIDTTALLEPQQLHDAGGNPLNPVLH